MPPNAPRPDVERPRPRPDSTMASGVWHTTTSGAARSDRSRGRERPVGPCDRQGVGGESEDGDLVAHSVR